MSHALSLASIGERITVESHVRNIMNKLGVGSRAQIAFSMRGGRDPRLPSVRRLDSPTFRKARRYDESHRGSVDVQQFIKAGLIDELRIHFVLVLLGDGTRLFDRMGPEQVNWKARA